MWTCFFSNCTRPWDRSMWDCVIELFTLRRMQVSAEGDKVKHYCLKLLHSNGREINMILVSWFHPILFWLWCHRGIGERLLMSTIYFPVFWVHSTYDRINISWTQGLRIMLWKVVFFHTVNIVVWMAECIQGTD